MTETETSAEPRSGGEGATGSRRKLTEEQEREVTRLYAETDTPVSEISKRFGIGESSVYRVAQRHGAALRGRSTTTPKAAPKPRAAAAAASTPAAAGPGRGRGRRRAAGAATAPAAAGGTRRRAAATSTP